MITEELEAKIELLNKRINLLGHIIEELGEIVKRQLPSIENDLSTLGIAWVDAEKQLADPINLDKKVRGDNE